MTARKDHHHKRGTDCQRGERTGTLADDRAPNCQNQEEGSDKFSHVLLHKQSPSTLDVAGAPRWLWLHLFRMLGQPSSSCRYGDPVLPSRLLRWHERCSRTDAAAHPASACERGCPAESSSHGHPRGS